MFVVVFGLIVGVIIATIVRGAKQYRRNNESPVLTVECRIISRRMQVTHHHHTHAGDNTGMHWNSSTDYFVTFEVESGDRLEFYVPGQEYGLLAEGDCGKLTFQGTRYLGFVRHRPGTGLEK